MQTERSEVSAVLAKANELGRKAGEEIPFRMCDKCFVEIPASHISDVPNELGAYGVCLVCYYESVSVCI